MKNEFRVFLPYPPTVNHYWGKKGKRWFIKPRGLKFRHDVWSNFLLQNVQKIVDGRIKLSIKAYMPDNRKRDIDNLLKATLDAITHTELVWTDDNQVDKLYIERVPKRNHQYDKGALEVTISEIL